MTRILGIPGSLRDGSYNRLLLHAAQEVAPQGVEIEIYEIDEIPLYNEDLDTKDPPEPVARLRQAIGQADGVLIATPEYNYSVPGVLKNAMDWASRPYGGSVLEAKPLAIMGASGGRSGTMRAQLAWQPVFKFTGSPVVGKPEVYVSDAPDKFDREGRLVDQKARALIGELVENLVALAHRPADELRIASQPAAAGRSGDTR